MAHKRFDIDSKMFDMKTYFKDQVRAKQMDELIKMDNQVNSEIRSLDGELQTLVYENYNKFISATDIVKSIKNNMNELDVELDSLKESISKINTSYENIDDKLKYKWKEIRRLDTLQTDLNRLKDLRELPDTFKEAISQYENNSDSIEILEDPIKQYIDFKDVLENFKDSSFMSNLYEEISNNVAKVKNYLRRDIEREERDSNEFFKMAKYLIQLGVDKDDIRAVFTIFKTQNIQNRIERIKELAPMIDEVDPKIQKRLLELHGKNLKDSHYYEEENQEEEKVSMQAFEKENVEQPTKFDKKEIIEEIKERQTVSIGMLKSSQLKQGTVSWFIKKFSEQLVDFIIQTINEYKELFSATGKPTKQFLTNFLNAYLSAQKELLGERYMSYFNMTECLSTIYKDAERIGSQIDSKLYSIIDRVCEIAESTIRKQLINSMKRLYKKTADTLYSFSVKCDELFSNEESKEFNKADQHKVLQNLTETCYEELMTDCSITIGEARPLVKYQEQFLGGNNAFISLIHNQIVEYFQVFAEMIKVNIEKSSLASSSVQKQNKQESIDMEVSEEKKIKGLVNQSLKEVEILPLNSLKLLSIISLCSKIEEMGMPKVISIVNDLVHAEETKDSNSMLGSVELWSNFELEKIPIIKSKLKALLKHCNKFYILFVSKYINFHLKNYTNRFTFDYSTEPVLISSEIVEI